MLIQAPIYLDQSQYQKNLTINGIGTEDSIQAKE
jgi:hypothetical protein